MLSHRIYYSLKPYLPWHFRIGMRRFSAHWKRRSHKARWPIDPAAAKKPAGWAGWPDQKRMAVVLTHDVEGPEGLAKSQQLAELEMKYGFRSSFNFIPEGTYSVSPELRRWLVDRGFEVGIHDLQHDGKLFRSRAGFQRSAGRINSYIRDWQATGFRGGFMLRNLEWIHDLHIQYDCSTFDTDPFEPQSDGVGTIFPFWIPRPAAMGASSAPDATNGYVELPYTLPQDSTLFLILRERTPDIWLRKLDWIAQNSGMALVNVHPDYIDFSGNKPKGRHYSVSQYAALLEHVSKQYSGQYWNALPHTVTTWYKSVMQPATVSAGSKDAQRVGGTSARSTAPLRGKKAAVLLYSTYPADPRPRRATEALVEAGMEVDLICLRQGADQPAVENVGGVNVRRLPFTHRRGGKFEYVAQYAAFLLSSFFILGWRALRKRYSLVHVHNMPDVLAFSALIPKLRGARIILDLHDPMPELMMTIFGLKQNSWEVGLIQWLEKLSIRFSDVVITVNQACRKLFSARSCGAEKIRVVMNSPDESIFAYQPAPAQPPATASGRFVMMYHGSLVERHGLDIAVDALAKIRSQIPGAELRIYGLRTPFLDRVLQSVEASDLKQAVRYLGPQNLEQIVEGIRGCDVGIIPNRRSIFTEINTPTRIFEYLSQGKPVIAPRAPGILDYFGEDEITYFELGDADDLARQLLQIYQNPAATLETVRRGQSVYRRHAWSSERLQFVELVTTLMPGEAAPVMLPVQPVMACKGEK